MSVAHDPPLELHADEIPWRPSPAPDLLNLTDGEVFHAAIAYRQAFRDSVDHIALLTHQLRAARQTIRRLRQRVAAC